MTIWDGSRSAATGLVGTPTWLVEGGVVSGLGTTVAWRWLPGWARGT